MTNENNDEKFVSDLYQASDKAQASAKTDEAILEYARHRVASNNKPKLFLSQRNRWLSVAASVALVSLIFVSQWQDFTPQGLQSDPESVTPEPMLQKAAPDIEPESDFVTTLADEAQRTQTAARSAPALLEMTEQMQTTGSLQKTVDSGIKIECRYSVDGGRPLSDSALGKYIDGLNFKEKRALTTAINTQMPLAQLSEQSDALAKLTATPGFKEHYQMMAAQVKSCVAETGPAQE